MNQLTFDLPAYRQHMSRQDYIETGVTMSHLALLDRWWNTGDSVLAICGAASAGKTHLASIVAAEQSGLWVSVDAIDDHPGSPDQAPLIVIDDVHRVSNRDTLFDLVEAARLGATRLVLTGQGRPGDWGGDLADLVTRLEAAARLEIAPPDEATLFEVITKRFADLQVYVDPRVASYAAPRLRRSFAALEAFVHRANALSYAKKSPITVALAKKALEGSDLNAT